MKEFSPSRSMREYVSLTPRPSGHYWWHGEAPEGKVQWDERNKRGPW